MRHRKKLIAAALLLAVAGAGLLIWPREDPEARRLLVELRVMVEANAATNARMDRDRVYPPDSGIELDVLAALINVNDASMGLFARSGGDNKVKFARLASDTRLRQGFENLRSRGAAKVLAMPRYVVASGERFTIVSGGETPVVDLDRTIQYLPIGTTVDVLSKMTPAGTILLDVRFELVRAADRVDEPTASVPGTQIVVERRQALLKSELNVGQTLVIGGMVQRGRWSSDVKLPVLGELPGIGPRFCVRREREVDEELVVLVTPCLLGPDVPLQSIPRRLPGREPGVIVKY